MDQRLDPGAAAEQRGEHAGAGTQIERAREDARHVVQPLDEPLRRLAEKEVVIGETARRALAMRAHGPAVEDDRRSHGTSPSATGAARKRGRARARR